jgi:hypothetical protein
MKFVMRAKYVSSFPLGMIKTELLPNLAKNLIL